MNAKSNTQNQATTGNAPRTTPPTNPPTTEPKTVPWWLVLVGIVLIVITIFVSGHRKHESDYNNLYGLGNYNYSPPKNNQSQQQNSSKDDYSEMAKAHSATGITASNYVEALIIPGITTIIRSGPVKYIWENGKEFADTATGIDKNHSDFLKIPGGRAKIYAYRPGDTVNVTWCQCTLQQLLKEKNQ
ncbi:MAG TPA: hypothetical protein VG694_00445 [Candidatus Paceibacterota bacterium]|jgi:hypothetical protein|nr:hypothetical protein [Candidatus Paceibacterota bacterium]